MDQNRQCVCMVIYRDILGSCPPPAAGLQHSSPHWAGVRQFTALQLGQTQGKVDIKRREPLGHGVCHTFVMGIPYQLSSSSTLNLLGGVLKLILPQLF